MTPEQIRRWETESGLEKAYLDDEYAGPPTRCIAEFARLVAADTWERAAAICDEMVTRAHSNAAVLIAAAENIRAAAAKEAKS